jgi:uncharacterized linocin/CFP29 family protein
MNAKRQQIDEARKALDTIERDAKALAPIAVKDLYEPYKAIIPPKVFSSLITDLSDMGVITIKDGIIHSAS